MADDETNKKIRETIANAKEAVQGVVIDAQLEKLERTPGNSIREVCISARRVLVDRTCYIFTYICINLYVDLQMELSIYPSRGRHLDRDKV